MSTNIIDKNYAGEGIYRENILDHYAHPRNFGKLQDYDAEYHEFNPLCGDEETIQIKVENNKIKDVKFFGKGCAISIATSSILLSEVQGKKIEEVKKITKEDVFKMINIPISPLRVKCACLSLEALRRAIKVYEGEDFNMLGKKVCI